MTGCDVLTTEDFEHGAIAELARHYKLVAEPALYGQPGALRERLREARTVMIRNQTKLTREVLECAPNLFAIGRVGVGLDNIDLHAASELGIVVIAPLDANAVSVAELAIGLMIALARKIPQADRSTKAGGWDRKGCTGIELQGKTVLLCGYGRIGRLVAARARAFGMRVLVFDPFVRVTEPDVVAVPDIIEGASQADFVSVHAPLTEQTRGLIGANVLAAMKRTAYLLNTARGGIVDEAALLEALRDGRIAGAALDVRETEPASAPNVFAAMENVILTPHIASFTGEAQTRTFEAVCTDLERILRGEPAVNFVNFATPKNR